MITLDAHEGIQDAISKVFLNLYTNLDLTKNSAARFLATLFDKGKELRVEI